jgi:uncharacterized FlaG/YvyC family protein
MPGTENKIDVSKTASQTVESIQNQLSNYGDQIQKFLKDSNANVEDYKFAIQKTENGNLSVEIAFKATIGTAK